MAEVPESVGLVSKISALLTAPSSLCSRSSGAPGPAAEAPAKSRSAPSARVSSVSRRKNSGGKRSTLPAMTPYVSKVSISPLTLTVSSLSGPATLNRCARLPNAS